MVAATYIVVFAAGLVLSLALTPFVRRLALAVGAVDEPGERKIHTQPVPRLGGVAVLLAVSITIAAALWLQPELRPAVAGPTALGNWVVLTLAALLVVSVGMIDDLRDLDARTKFLLEVGAASAVVAVAGAPSAIDLAPLAQVQLGLAGPVLGVLWIVAITNAVNLTDGTDGVAAGVGAIGATALGLASLNLGNTVAATVLLAVSGALLGFLPHNFRRSKMFLGDSGSLGLGFVLGSASLVGLNRAGSWLAVPAALALAPLVTEVGLTVIRRTLENVSVRRADLPSERFILEAGLPHLFTPDRRHIPHRLLDLGLGPGVAAAALYLFGIMLGALAVASVDHPWLGPFAALMALALLVYLAPRWLYGELRLLERGALLPLLDCRLIRWRPLQMSFDASVVGVSYLVAEWLVQGGAPVSVVSEAWPRAAGMIPVVLVGFWLAGLYRTAYRHAGISEMMRASRSVVLGLVLGAGVMIISGHPIPASVWFLTLFFTWSAVTGGRLSFRVLDHIHQSARQDGRRVLVFGAGRAGDLAVRQMLGNPALGLLPVGFVDDDPGKANRELHGLPIFAGREIARILPALRVDDLIVATTKASAARLERLAEACLGERVRLLQFGVLVGEVNGDGRDHVPNAVWPPASAPGGLAAIGGPVTLSSGSSPLRSAPGEAGAAGAG